MTVPDEVARAGTVVEDARLVDADGARRRWLQASSAITRALLASDRDDVGVVLGPIADQCREITGADLVTVALPVPPPPGADPVELRVHTAVGPPGTETLRGQVLPLRGTLAGRVFTTGAPVRQSGRHLEGPHTDGVEFGPALAVPLPGARCCHGVVTAARRRGRTEFAATDLDTAADFADHACLAIELVEAQARHRHAALLEDRDRIAADLHDHVIQRLFATGLSLGGLVSLMDGDPRRARIDAAVDDLDEVVRQIRTTIFDLRTLPGTGPSSARARLLEVVDAFAPVLGLVPEIHIDQALDGSVPRAVVDDLLAVLWEALSNIARHARAGAVRVATRTVAGQLTLEVVDDGVGLGSSTRCSGLGNLRRRAEHHHGTLTLAANTPRGTCLTWTVTLTPPGAGTFGPGREEQRP